MATLVTASLVVGLAGCGGDGEPDVQGEVRSALQGKCGCIPQRAIDIIPVVWVTVALDLRARDAGA